MSDASSDEFLAEVIEDFGLEGYARWWIILETIAAQMDKTGKCSVTYSWVKWQSLLKGKRNKLRTFLEHLENESKLKLKQNGNKLEISCPKLLKLRDNYTKDCQVPEQEPIPPDSKQEVEVEVERPLSLGAGEAAADPKVTPLRPGIRPDEIPAILLPASLDAPPGGYAVGGVVRNQNSYAMSDQWEPDRECVKALCLGMGVPEDRITPEAVFEFRSWWSDKTYRDTNRGWVTRMIRRLKEEDLKNPHRAAVAAAPGFLEKHTDQSWREGLLDPQDDG